MGRNVPKSIVGDLEERQKSRPEIQGGFVRMSLTESSVRRILS